jgi:hypothetical protein
MAGSAAAIFPHFPLLSAFSSDGWNRVRFGWKRIAEQRRITDEKFLPYIGGGRNL